MELRPLIEDFLPKVNLKLKNGEEPITLSAQDWESYANAEKILKYPYEATMKMQEESLTLVDFFVIWRNLSMILKSLKLKMAEDIVQAMKIRENDTKILKAPPTLACVFLHFKYGLILDDSEKSMAVQHIINVWQRIKSVSSCNNPEIINALEISDQRLRTENDCVDIEDLLKLRHNNSSSQMLLQDDVSSATHAIRRYELLMRKSEPIDSKATSIEFWSRYKSVERDLYKVACVLNSAAPTQVSVERCFSALSIVLNPQRTNLTATNLNNIMVVGMNKDHFNVINLDEETLEYNLDN